LENLTWRARFGHGRGPSTLRLKTGYHISGDSDPLASAAEAQRRHIARLEARNGQQRRRLALTSIIRLGQFEAWPK